VEKLLLGSFLALEKMDVIDEQEVDFAIPSAKFSGRTILDRSDEIVCELFCADQGYSNLRASSDNLVANRLHQVGFPEAGRTVDEQWVVDLPWSLGNGVSGGGGKLVRLSDDEVVEGISVTQWRFRDSYMLL
jgi:hypothetical protein